MLAVRASSAAPGASASARRTGCPACSRSARPGEVAAGAEPLRDAARGADDQRGHRASSTGRCRGSSGSTTSWRSSGSAQMLRDGLADVDVVGVGDQAALRPAGRARCVEDRHLVVWARREWRVGWRRPGLQPGTASQRARPRTPGRDARSGRRGVTAPPVRAPQRSEPPAPIQSGRTGTRARRPRTGYWWAR